MGAATGGPDGEGLAAVGAPPQAVGSFYLPVLIRATIENCAHAVWVLGDDPDEPSENRLARAYLEELVSALEAKKNAGRMRDKTHESYARASDYYRRLQREIIERFPGATKETLGSKTLNGEAMPNLEAAVIWMYELTMLHGGTIDGRTAAGIYGLLSNMTHPTLYPVKQMRQWSADARGGHPVAHLRIDLKSAENQATAPLSAFYNALAYVTSYFGWPTAVVDNLI